jgi:hypothetical protein
MASGRAGRWINREVAHFALALGVIVAAAFAIGPTLTRAADDAGRARLVGSLESIRAALHLHRNSTQVRVVHSGWPAAIHPSWFAGGELPRHPVTSQSMRVEVVDDGADAIAPREKTFLPDDGSARHLWYNRSNGAVCVRVPAGDSAEAALARFNDLNGLALSEPLARR